MSSKRQNSSATQQIGVARVGVAAVFTFIRLMERMLPPSGLRRFLMPFIATRVALRQRRPSQPLPECLGGGTFRPTKRQQRIASLNSLLAFFPEQLRTP